MSDGLRLASSSSPARAVLASVPVAEVAHARAELEEACFAPSEQQELRARAVRTMAGRLALKRALCQLCSKAAGVAGEPAAATSPVSERDFVLARHESGAPRLVAGPAHWPLSDERLWVSISHSPEHAYGLAAWQSACSFAAAGGQP